MIISSRKFGLIFYAINPVTLNYHSVLVLIFSMTILSIIFPLSLPYSSITIIISTIAALFPIFKTSNIFCFLININSLTIITLKFSIFEITLVNSFFTCIRINHSHLSFALHSII